MSLLDLHTTFSAELATVRLKRVDETSVPKLARGRTWCVWFIAKMST